MYTSLPVLSLLAFTTTTLAGSARVWNQCPFDVTLWSVGSSISAPSTIAANGGIYTEPFTRDPQTGGKALKITLDPNGLYNGAAQTVFAYTLDTGANQVWYDLSDVFGDAFAGNRVVEQSADGSCPTIVWESGTPPAGSQVKVCEADSDVQLALCSTW